jgi:hypothetical protein
MSFFSDFFTGVETDFKKLFSGAPGATMEAVVLSDLKLVATGLSNSLAGFASVSGLDPAATAKVQALIGKIATDSNSIVSTMQASAAQPIVAQIGAGVSELTSIFSMAGIVVPPPFSLVLQAVTTLLPFIEAGVGLLTTQTVHSSTSVKLSEATGMSVDTARATLAAA